MYNQMNSLLKDIPGEPIHEPNQNNAFVKQFESEIDDKSVTYGCYIVINFETLDEGSRKLTTNFRISDKAQALPMEKENYDDNSLFRIIPPCQYEMQDNIRNIISSGFLPEHVNVDYENFRSELETNLSLQDKTMGQEIKYGSKFQLYQHSSKRYLSIKPADDDIVINAFQNGYTDSLCFQICFSEYPSEFTHFTFEECCLFQKRNQTGIKDNHYLYLVSHYGYNTLYAYNVDKQPFMTKRK